MEKQFKPVPDVKELKYHGTKDKPDIKIFVSHRIDLNSENMPNVSIIVPVYNVEKYIVECMDSLVGQTLKNIEIVLVDNGSEDASSGIIQWYAKKDKRIKIIKLESNQGLAKARNIGLSHATGEYIAFVDSDDLCDVTMYEKMYRKAKHLNADVVTCNVLRFEKDWRDGTDHHPEAWYIETNQAMPITSCPEQFMEQAAWAKIMRHAYIRTLSYKFTPGSVCCEDVPACTHLFLNTSRIAIVNETLYFYRNRPDSLSNNMNRNYTNDFIWAMTQQNNIINECGFHDDLTWGFIVQMRFLLANHIISKMKKEDVNHYFENMHNVFKKDDAKYLAAFFGAFPTSKLLFEAILERNAKKYSK